MGSGWSFNLTCPSYDQPGLSGYFSTSNNSNGFSCAGGCGSCQRLPFSRLQQMNFSGATLPAGVNLNAATVFSVNVGKFLFVPPLLSTDTNPIFTVASQCNNYTGNVHYLFIQIDPADFASIKNGYLWGNSTLSPVSTTLTNNYDINGQLTWSGSQSLPIGTCSGGVWTVSGSVDFNATMYTGYDWSGVYKTAPGRATVFLPDSRTTQSYLGNLSYAGMVFSSGIPGSVKNIQAKSNAAGSVFTLTAYDDVATGALSTTAYDLLTISAVNSPFNGAMRGTVNHYTVDSFGNASQSPGSGRVVCLVYQSGGYDGQLVACSGEDPADNTKPYSMVINNKPASGTLDTLFNGTGYTIVDMGGAGPNYGERIAIQADGKVVISGQVYNGTNYDIGLARVNADGSLDTGFGTAGTVITPLGFTTIVTQGLAIQSDGKIIVAQNDATNMRVYRYNTDGSLDSTFNATGYAKIGAAGDTRYVTVQSDGKIVVVGDSTQNYQVARLNPDGSADTTFGGGSGYVITSFGARVLPRNVQQQPDGKLLVAGQNNYGNYFTAARYNTDGSLDATLNPAGAGPVPGPGMLTTNVGGYNGYGYGLALLPDGSGRFVISGRVPSSPNGQRQSAVVRYHSDGSLDTTFNITGYHMSSYTYGSGDFDVAIQSDGKYLLLENPSFDGVNAQISLTRLNGDGTVDTSFNNGTGSAPVIANGGNLAQSLQIQQDGAIVVGGYVTDTTGRVNFVIARFRP